MYNANSINSPLLFNNNKSLYGSRTQANQLSRKISLIEDKRTLEPARTAPSAPTIAAINSNFSCSTSASILISSELSTLPIQKKIEIQKQALESFDLVQTHDHVYQELNEWKSAMCNRVQSMKDEQLKEQKKSYKNMITIQKSMQQVLQEQFIRQLLYMKNNPQAVNPEELDEIEQRLEEIKIKIDSMKNINLQIDLSNVQITGELQLNKMTDCNKHKPLLYPTYSPPPPPTTTTTTTVPPSPQLLSSPVDKTPKSCLSIPVEVKPTPPIWTDATRQGLNNISHNLPLRLLIPNHVRQELIESLDIEQFSDDLKLSCQSSAECILTIIDKHDIDASIDILTDLIGTFKCSSNQYEFRLLFQNKVIPIITGKRNERVERYREKYKLDMVKIFTQTCPQSIEQVVLLRSQHSEYIIYCLREIIQNILEQAHFTDEDSNQSYSMYDPSVNYDESIAHEYGAYKPNDVCEIVTNENNYNNNTVTSSEDLTESKHRSTISMDSSSSSLSKVRYSQDDSIPNYDDTNSESGDNDDESKRSKSSDDNRIYMKQLNYVKGRQVGLLIGPFGQHITQIREQTGAKIHLTNDDSEPSVIKGTKSQISHALRLINECLQTQKPIPKTVHKGGRRR